jgi:carboxyl-terminal processing protease
LIQRAYEGREKDQYQREAFERNEREGENIEHREESDTTRPVFKTSLGRVVYGGGGITPDYIQKPTPITPLTENILRRDMFFQFIKDYLDVQGQNIRATYGKDLLSFKKSFTVTDQLMSEFRSFVTKKGVEVDEKNFQKDFSLLKTRLKAEIARRLWNQEGFSTIMLDTDTQFQKAVGLFPEAERIARLN